MDSAIPPKRRWILDSLDQPRVVSKDDGYCIHIVALDEPCTECEELSEQLE